MWFTLFFSFFLAGSEHMNFHLVPNADVYWRLTLDSISRHTHNTYLLNLRLPKGNYLDPPPGAHVFLRRRIKPETDAPSSKAAPTVITTLTTEGDGEDGLGKLVSRPYTPIHPSFDDSKTNNHAGKTAIFYGICLPDANSFFLGH